MKSSRFVFGPEEIHIDRLSAFQLGINHDLIGSRLDGMLRCVIVVNDRLFKPPYLFLRPPFRIIARGRF